MTDVDFRLLDSGICFDKTYEMRKGQFDLDIDFDAPEIKAAIDQTVLLIEHRILLGIL